MRLKLTIILFILNVILFGLILFIENRSVEDSSVTMQDSLLGSVILQAEKITIEGPGMETPRILEKPSGKRSWVMTTPFSWPANLFAVSRILNQLQFLDDEISFSLEEIRRSGQSLEDYGLDNPRLIITVVSPQDTISMKVGATTEMGNRLYLLGPRGERIFVVDRRLLESLLVSVRDLRDPRIFDIPVFEVSTLSMRITVPGDVTIRLAREGENWVFEAPLAAAADPGLVNTTIKELTGLEALRFFDPGEIPPEVSGLNAPTRRVTLQGNGRRETLILGNEVTDGPGGEKKYFAKLEDNPTVVTVPARPFDELFEAQQKLRDPTVFRFQEEALNTVEIEHANRRVTIQRLENGKWQILEIGKDGLISTHPADPEVMHNLISGLKDLEVSEFVSDAPSATALNEEYGLKEPNWTLSLTTDSGTMRLFIGQIYRRPDKELLLYARRENSSSVYGLEQRVLRLLRIDPLHYRNRQLRVLPSGAKIVSIRLLDLETRESLLDRTIDPDEESWVSMLESSDMDPEKKANLIDLQKYFRNFRVAGYLNDRFQENYLEEDEKTIPWSYKLEISILLSGSEGGRRVEENYFLTKRLSGNFLAAGSPDFDLVFQLNQEMIDALFPFLFTREKPEEYERPEAAPQDEPQSEPSDEEEITPGIEDT